MAVVEQESPTRDCKRTWSLDANCRIASLGLALRPRPRAARGVRGKRTRVDGPKWSLQFDDCGNTWLCWLYTTFTGYDPPGFWCTRQTLSPGALLIPCQAVRAQRQPQKTPQSTLNIFSSQASTLRYISASCGTSTIAQIAESSGITLCIV